MTILELKEAINELPDDMEIILQKDSEGNGYSPLYTIDSDCIYETESSYGGDVFSTYWTAKESGFETEEEWEEFKKNNVKCLVLVPTN